MPAKAHVLTTRTIETRGLLALLALVSASLFVDGMAEARAAEPLVTKFGLGTLLHPIQEPSQVPLPSCYDKGPCRCAKEHVYVFGVNGLNPLCIGNFNGLCCYLKKQGIENTYFGQLYTSHWFVQKIREIRQTDPQARIALIGFSFGANYVQGIVNLLAKDGTKVDLVVYMVGDFIFNTPASYPANVDRVVNVRAHGLVFVGGDLFFNGADIDGARNVHLKCRHILVPSRRETLALMMEELLMLACQPCAPSECERLSLPPIVVPRK